MITIRTHSHNPLTKEFWGHVLAHSILRRYRGPTAVRESLTRGLDAHKITYVLDPFGAPKHPTIVLSGTKAVAEAVAQKKHGKIPMLIVGPNVTVTPHDVGGIMQSPEIDAVLVPSEWVANFWRHEAPELAPKIFVWPAGVAEASASTRVGAPILYDKINDAGLRESVLATMGISARVFTYGSFKRKDYLDALATAPYMIYLSKSESQGLALQEAWAHDVPTLVNTSTHWESGRYSWNASQINCPYLTPELGRIFEKTEELPGLIEEIQSLHPKQYCDKSLSDRACAEKLLEITRTIEKRI